MTSDELETAVEAHLTMSGAKATGVLGIKDDELLVIKYLPAKYLSDTLRYQRLYAAERAGFTWGDALYVAPASYPRTTMMYGEVGVMGSYRASASTRMFDASDPNGIALYQEWITWQKDSYLELTTTVYADLANRDLRNEFRNRFRIDCVFFRPDEPCKDYVVMRGDWWLAVTHWDASGRVASGPADEVKNLKWCVVGPDSFGRNSGRGFEAYIHTPVSSSHQYTAGHYSTLEADIRNAYTSAGSRVVMCDFG